jgi:hypothetical protein
MPSKCGVFKDHIFPKAPFYFRCTEENIYYKKSDHAPRIVIYTKDRELYFKLTLLGLIESLTFCPDVPITLILNSPTKDVLDTAMVFQEKHRNIEVLVVQENAGFAAANIAMQWYGIAKIIAGEDDFLLSDAVKNLYPQWPYQFYDKLEFVDYVGWQCLHENMWYGWYNGWADPQTFSRLGWFYDKTLPGGFIPIGGQLVAYTKEFMKKAYEPGFHSLQDSLALKEAKKIATPFLKGYHIGWNKIRYGFDNSKDYATIAHNKLVWVTVTSIRTQETRKINLTALFD